MKFVPLYSGLIDCNFADAVCQSLLSICWINASVNLIFSIVKLIPTFPFSFFQLMKCLSDDYHANVTKINIPHMDQAFDIFLNTMKDKPHIPHTQKIANFDGHKNPWLELVKKMVGASDHTLPVIIVSILETCLGDPKSESGRELIRRGEIIQEKLFSMLGDDGIFIYPAFPEPAINHYTSILKFQNIGYSSLFSLMGNPITTCPIGLSKNEHLPFGVQVMASPFNDHLTIAVARAIEEKLGGWKPPSRVELKSN